MRILFFRFKDKRKTPTFEEWLDTNGYYYIRTKEDKPCFKSVLTRKLKKKYSDEIGL